MRSLNCKTGIPVAGGTQGPTDLFGGRKEKGGYSGVGEGQIRKIDRENEVEE